MWRECVAPEAVRAVIALGWITDFVAGGDASLVCLS